MLSFNHYNSSSGQFALSSTANSLNTLPSYESSLEDNLDLVKVLGKLAIDGFRQLNRFFTWHSGEKASLEETQIHHTLDNSSRLAQPNHSGVVSYLPYSTLHHIVG